MERSSDRVNIHSERQTKSQRIKQTLPGKVEFELRRCMEGHLSKNTKYGFCGNLKGYIVLEETQKSALVEAYWSPCMHYRD